MLARGLKEAESGGLSQGQVVTGKQHGKENLKRASAGRTPEFAE